MASGFAMGDIDLIGESMLDTVVEPAGITNSWLPEGERERIEGRRVWCRDKRRWTGHAGGY